MLAFRFTKRKEYIFILTGGVKISVRWRLGRIQVSFDAPPEIQISKEIRVNGDNSLERNASDSAT